MTSVISPTRLQAQAGCIKTMTKKVIIEHFKSEPRRKVMGVSVRSDCHFKKRSC